MGLMLPGHIVCCSMPPSTSVLPPPPGGMHAREAPHAALTCSTSRVLRLSRELLKPFFASLSPPLPASAEAHTLTPWLPYTRGCRHDCGRNAVCHAAMASPANHFSLVHSTQHWSWRQAWAAPTYGATERHRVCACVKGTSYCWSR